MHCNPDSLGVRVQQTACVVSALPCSASIQSSLMWDPSTRLRAQTVACWQARVRPVGCGSLAEEGCQMESLTLNSDCGVPQSTGGMRAGLLVFMMAGDAPWNTEEWPMLCLQAAGRAAAPACGGPGGSQQGGLGHPALVCRSDCPGHARGD